MAKGRRPNRGDRNKLLMMAISQLGPIITALTGFVRAGRSLGWW